MCRDFIQKHSCPRGAHCTFAHSKAEMDKYRAKSRQTNGPILPSMSTSSNNMSSSITVPSTNSLPIFTSTNSANVIRPAPPQILSLWNPQQQAQGSHLIQELPQQHHHQ